MEKKTNEGLEIVSFNASVPELPSLLELDDAILDMVTGGSMRCRDFGCGTFGCSAFECTANA